MTVENTQYEVLELAQQRINEPGVAALLRSVNEAKCDAMEALRQLKNYCVSADIMLFDPNSRVPLGNTEVVLYATRHAQAMYRINCDIATLAGLLYDLGVDIVY